MSPSSSTPIELGSTSPRIPSKQSHEAWTDASQAQLFKWLEETGNYAKWKCTGSKNSNDSSRTSKLTKKVVTIISKHLEALNTKKTSDQFMSKLKYVETKFKEAEDFLRGTGVGITSNDEKMGITKIQEKVLSLCPFYYQVKPFMSKNVAINPPFVEETGMDQDIPEIMFGMCTRGKVDDSFQEDGPYGLSEDETSSAAEEEYVAEESLGEQEPLPNHISEGMKVKFHI